MSLGYRFAIITDIHGNSSALKAVLDDIDKDKHIDHIYCLGDLIGIGHETNEVLDLIFSRKDISFVTGNHDEAILKIIDGKDPGSVGEVREHHEWIASRLNKKFIPQLQSIPKKLMANVNGKNLLFLHYHLDEDDKFLPIDTNPTITKLNDIYKHDMCDIVCFGHHHIIHHFKSNERLYVNPGSLGCNHKPIAPYAILQVRESGLVDVSFIEVPYDNENFLLSYQKLNVPAKESILKIFYGEQHLKYI